MYPISSYCSNRKKRLSILTHCITEKMFLVFIISGFIKQVRLVEIYSAGCTNQNKHFVCLFVKIAV